MLATIHSLDCADADFLTQLDAKCRGPQSLKVARLVLQGFEHLRTNPRIQTATLSPRLSCLAQRHPRLQIVATASNSKESWQLDLGQVDRLAEALSLGLPPRVKPQPLTPKSRPFWLDPAKGLAIELLDPDGTWALWLAMRGFFDGLSLRDIGTMLDERAPRKSSRTWNKDVLARTFDDQRLCPPDRAAVEEPKPYVMGRRVWDVLRDEKRGDVTRGRKPAGLVPDSPWQLLLKGINLECRACRSALEGRPGADTLACELDLSGAPDAPAHPNCHGAVNPLEGKSREEAAKLALAHIAARVQQDKMRFFEIGNPFVDDEPLVRQVIDEMNAEFRSGQPAPRPAGYFEGPDPWVLLDRVSGRHPRQVDHRTLVLQWLDQPPVDPVQFRSLWLALARRFRWVSLDTQGLSRAKPRLEGDKQAEVLYSIRGLDALPGAGGTGAMVTVRTSGWCPKLGFGGQAGAQVQVINRCGPDFDAWVAPIRETFEGISLEPEGLGAWLYAAKGGDGDGGWDAFVRAIRSHLKAHPLTRIELIKDSGARDELGSVDIVETLGAYGSAKVKAAPGRPTVYLFPARIEESARELGADALDLARVVLRHECGHHLAPTSPEEPAYRVNDDSNPATMRAEAAAQLFAWLTSTPAERGLMEKLAKKQAAPYRAYLQVIAFARGEALPGPGLRPGWLLAWSTVRESHFGTFAGLPASEDPLAALQAGWQHLQHGFKAEARWPLLAFLGSASARMFLENTKAQFSLGYRARQEKPFFKNLFDIRDAIRDAGYQLAEPKNLVRLPPALQQGLPAALVILRRNPSPMDAEVRVYVPTEFDVEQMRESKQASAGLERLDLPMQE
jgi:hypothetical protein